MSFMFGLTQHEQAIVEYVVRRYARTQADVNEFMLVFADAILVRGFALNDAIECAVQRLRELRLSGAQ